MLAIPPTEDLSSTPLTSQDEGYSHGVSIDSMIVTPSVSTLGEQSPNVGRSTNTEPQKMPIPWTESIQIPQSNKKFKFLKRAVTMMASTTSSIEKDFKDLMLEHTWLINLAKDRLHRIQTLESLLEREKTTSVELQQSLNMANEELQRLTKEKEMNN